MHRLVFKLLPSSRATVSSHLGPSVLCLVYVLFSHMKLRRSLSTNPRKMCCVLKTRLFVAVLLAVFATRSASELSRCRNAHHENQSSVHAYNDALRNAHMYAKTHGHLLLLSSSGDISYIGPEDSVMNDLICRVHEAGDQLRCKESRECARPQLADRGSAADSAGSAGC